MTTLSVASTPAETETSTPSTCPGYNLDQSPESQAVARMHARRRAIADSPIFARIWRVAVMLEESRAALASLVVNLEADTAATIFADAGLPPAQPGDPFGADALAGAHDALESINAALVEHTALILSDVAVLALPTRTEERRAAA